MPDGPTLRKTLVRVIHATRIVIRCLASGRDSQEPSQRAILLLVDTLDLLYQIKEDALDAWAAEGKWFVKKQESRFHDIDEILRWFDSMLKTVELYFQPGGVRVCYFRKHLLERTFLPQLEQYKVFFLLWMQPETW